MKQEVHARISPHLVHCGERSDHAMANMASIAGRQPARFGAVVGSGGGGFVAGGNVGRGGVVDEAGPKDSTIDMCSHLPILFVVGGLCHHISSQLAAITCMSRSRRSRGDSWHWQNIAVVETSTVVVVVAVVVEERHFIVMVMGR